MKFIDMFAGIGGFRSGLEQAGHKCIGYIEWDKFARQSYQAMYDTQGEFTDNDIQKTKGIKLPEADLWTFGSPCTNISLAGNRTGIGGEQSRMFFEVIRLLKERAENQKTLPTYLIMENVKNLLSSNQGRDFAEVIYQMGKVGYDAEWCVFDSAEVVPQHRERIYIVGHLRGQRTRGVFPIQGQSKGSAKSKIKTLANDSETNFGSAAIVSDHGISRTIDATSYKHVPRVAIHQVGNYLKTSSFGDNPQTGRVYSPDGISPTLNTMQGGGQEPKALISKKQFGHLGQQAINTFNDNKSNILPGDVIEPYNHRLRKDGKTPTVTTRPEGLKTCILPITTDFRIRKLTPRECWRLQGFSDEQFDKAKKAGVSNSQLYKQAGNAVTVPVVRAIGEKLAENEAKKMR